MPACVKVQRLFITWVGDGRFLWSPMNGGMVTGMGEARESDDLCTVQSRKSRSSPRIATLYMYMNCGLKVRTLALTLYSKRRTILKEGTIGMKAPLFTTSYNHRTLFRAHGRK